jgi:hypothetical protein
LHAALATHPALFLSAVKEPKFFMCDGRPVGGQAGPGDAHSAQEWIWRRDRYEALFAAAPPGARRGERRGSGRGASASGIGVPDVGEGLAVALNARSVRHEGETWCQRRCPGGLRIGCHLAPLRWMSVPGRRPSRRVRSVSHCGTPCQSLVATGLGRYRSARSTARWTVSSRPRPAVRPSRTTTPR